MSEMLWGGRFEGGPDPEMMRLTSSIDLDVRLVEQDAAATKAHARVLVKAGLLDANELEGIDAVCDSLVAEWRAGSLKLAGDEDVHSLTERVLTERLGDTGVRIHAGRSRNDLVATDLRMWCRDRSRHLAAQVGGLLEALAAVAEQHVDTVMPGYTHLQRAQPVSLAFHLLAHGFALARDGKRFVHAAESADVSSLGAGALAGNTLGLDPALAASELDFADTFVNAMDAVSARDFAVDLVYACASCAVQLSRLAEEIVLWTSGEFAFARLDDAWSTGSSMMPQKRNPDLAELIRGRAAGAIGDLTAVLGLLKGLPLAYDRDLQEDKGIVFRSVDRTGDALIGMTRLIQALSFDVQRMEAAATGGGSWATDLAERLVGRGVAFRDAHSAVGRLVAELEKRRTELKDLVDGELADFDPSFQDDDRSVDSARTSMMARDSAGGTAPERVHEQLQVLRKKADDLSST